MQPFNKSTGIIKKEISKVFLKVGVVCFSLTLNMYKVTGQFPWSSLKETDRGMSTELNVRDVCVCKCVHVCVSLCGCMWLPVAAFFYTGLPCVLSFEREHQCHQKYLYFAHLCYAGLTHYLQDKL